MGESAWDDQAQSGELKEAINLFIWRWGHPKMTLEQAERIAVYICDALTEVSGQGTEIIRLADSVAYDRLAEIEARLTSEIEKWVATFEEQLKAMKGK